LGNLNVDGRTLLNLIEKKKDLGKPKRRWEDIIKFNLKERGYEGVNEFN
jgi:hypothetical protein